MKDFAPIFATKKTFVAYLTAGHGGLNFSQAAALALIDGGVDILEIGVPFSDPIADGPTIQAAMYDACQRGVSLNEVFTLITKIKSQRDIPIVLFSYYNPLFSSGLANTLQRAADAGVDATLIVDLPLEESAAYFQHAKQQLIAPIGLLSPSTSQARMLDIDTHSQGFLYYVCRNGTTGVKRDLPENFVSRMSAIKAQANNPVICGFGIGTRAVAKSAIAHADGFVVGSAFVAAISQGAKASDLQQLATDIDPR